MFNSAIKVGVVNNPLIHSLYNQRNDDALIAPSEPEFIVTENNLKITTENGQFLVTEG